MLWQGEDLENLLHKDIDELLKLYPKQSKKNLIRRKQEKRKGTDMEKSNEPRLSKEWTVNAYDHKDGEWKEALNRSYEYPVDKSDDVNYEDLLIRRAKPVIAPRNRVKPVKRDFERTVFFGDEQIYYRYYEDEYHPIHDESAMMCMRGLVRYLRPDRLHNLGDPVDFSQYSKYEPDSNHFTVQSAQLAIDRHAREWVELIHDAGPQLIEAVEEDSNHTIRIDKLARHALLNMFGLKRAGSGEDELPFLTYGWLMDFDKLGVKFNSGYGAIETKVYDDLLAFHGKEIRSNGSTAELMSKRYPYTSTVRGHDHRFQMHTTTGRDGEYFYHVVIPALCDINGDVPGYHSAVDVAGRPVKKVENWQNGIVVLDRYEDGAMNWKPIFINKGVTQLDGLRFDGNVEDVDKVIQDGKEYGNGVH